MKVRTNEMSAGYARVDPRSIGPVKGFEIQGTRSPLRFDSG